MVAQRFDVNIKQQQNPIPSTTGKYGSGNLVYLFSFWVFKHRIL